MSQSLGLALQRWQGNYKGIDAICLRWATLQGELLPTPEEQERQRADEAESRLQLTVRNLLQAGSRTSFSVNGPAYISSRSAEELNTLLVKHHWFSKLLVTDLLGSLQLKWVDRGEDDEFPDTSQYRQFQRHHWDDRRKQRNTLIA